jgi:integrase
MLKGFCKWVVRNEYAETSPVADDKLRLLFDAKETDKRGFTQAEVVRLLEATTKAPYRYRMSGPARAILYLVAVETGIRGGALLKLTVGDFDFNNNKINIRPEINKNRTKHTVYLKPERAEQLKGYFKGKLPGVKAFQTLKSPRLADMVKDDLKETEVRDASGTVVIPAIPFLDSKGLKACFHSLRRTANTTIQNITRDRMLTKIILGHKVPKGDMTAHYYDVSPEQIMGVIEQLPGYEWPQQREAMAATGTDGKAVDEILPFSYQPKAHRKTSAESGGIQTHDTDYEGVLQGSNKGEHCLLPSPLI